MFRKIILTVTVGLVAVTLQAQSTLIHLRGKVIDQQGEPVPFAHMHIASENIGWVSNDQGEFNYKLSEKLKGHSISITHIRFKSKVIPIKAFLEGPVEVVLEELVITLPEAIVLPDENTWKRALSTMAKGSDDTYFINKKVLATFEQFENGKRTFFEQFILDLFGEKREGKEVASGNKVLAQRRSFDYSKFPQLSSYKGGEGHSSAYLFGEGADNSIARQLDKKEGLDDSFSTLTFDGEDSLLLINENRERGTVDYYLTMGPDPQIKKIVITTNSAIAYYHTHMLDNKRYNRFRYQLINSYEFDKLTQELKSISREERIQYIDRISGELILNHSNQMKVNILAVSPLDKLTKGDKNFERPLVLSYNEALWSQFDDQYNLVLPVGIEAPLTKETPLRDQFAETDGRIVLKNGKGNEAFSEYELRRVDPINVGELIEQLRMNTYQQGYPPDLGWKDIPMLLEISNADQLITRFPRNVLSRFYLDECPVGLVALWLIDSIRINEGKRKRKGWYISPMPLLQDAEDRKRNKATGDGKGFFIAENSNEKLKKAHEAFRAWWVKAQKLSVNKAKKINPLNSTDLKWQSK